MFSLLVSFYPTAWETDNLMRMETARFKEYSGHEADTVTLDDAETLKSLEAVPALLMYESGSGSANVGIVKYGRLRDIRVVGKDLVFRFEQEGQFPRSVVEEFGDRLGMGTWEKSRTHWAIKDGGIPTRMLSQLRRSYDVVFSFAGEDRAYVEEVAAILRSNGVSVFYDLDEEADLWGKDLADHFGA